MIMIIVIIIIIIIIINSVALVRERAIPTELPPPVGEVSANFLVIIIINCSPLLK